MKKFTNDVVSFEQPDLTDKGSESAYFSFVTVGTSPVLAPLLPKCDC